MKSNDNIVKLDIGGTVFKTSRSTLTKFDGFFKTMLETDIPITKDEYGAIFIDRSPKYFDMILNFMRDGQMKLPESLREVEELRVEAQYYLLDGLVELCNANIKAANDTVKLNVGGTIFQTTKTTLTYHDGYFKTLMNDESKVTRDENGYIFIDRSPRFFEIILGLMQNGPYTGPHCVLKVRMLKLEAEFYELRSLASLLENFQLTTACCGN
ncbi:unnamed protein product [Caenorhabditis brenneri]